jgi:hypothetical protein
VGSTCRRKGESAGYPFGVRGVAGPGQNGGWARKVPRGPFSYFSIFFSFFSFFLFSVLFHIFFFKFQNTSNQFLYSSNLQHYVPNQ